MALSDSVSVHLTLQFPTIEFIIVAKSQRTLGAMATEQHFVRNDTTWPLLFLIGICFVQIPAASAASFPESIQEIGRRWDEITYHWPKSQRPDGLGALLADIERLKSRYPQRAEPLIWQAITLTTLASLDPGLSSLDQVSQARDLLLRAVAIDPGAMRGSAYLALACLYYKVPGWPLSFGDPDKAEHYFQRALALNPDGIGNHYYYGHFLSKTGRMQEALAHFQWAARLPPDPAQPYLSLTLKHKAQEKLKQRLLQARL